MAEQCILSIHGSANQLYNQHSTLLFIFSIYSLLKSFYSFSSSYSLELIYHHRYKSGNYCFYTLNNFSDE